MTYPLRFEVTCFTCIYFCDIICDITYVLLFQIFLFQTKSSQNNGFLFAFIVFPDFIDYLRCGLFAISIKITLLCDISGGEGRRERERERERGEEREREREDSCKSLNKLP